LKNIEILYEYALDQSEYILPKELFLNALFFNTASALGLKRTRVVRSTNRGDKNIIPNYYGISFASSGVGKDHSNNIAKSIFDPMFKSFTDRAESFFHSNKDNDGKPDKKFVNLTSYFVPISSSVEGIQKAAQTVDSMHSGSINVTSDELGDTIGKMDPIFTKLKTSWDTGISEGQLNVSEGGENYYTVEDVGYNALLFGSPQPFELDTKKKDKLLEAYVSGMARRAFIYHNNTYKKSENRNPNVEKLSKESIENTTEYVKELRSFINNTKEMILPNDVYSALIEFDIEKEKSREKSHSLIAEDLSSPKKIEKLLGIIATLDLSSNITMDHLKFAIEFTEMMDKTAEETVEIKPIYVQIYNKLEQREFMARTDIVKSVKDVTLKSLEDEMTLVGEHANMVGNSIVKKEYGGIIKYRIEKLSKTSIDKVIISLNSNPSKFEPAGFVKKVGKFNNLHNVVNKYRYSAGTFHNNHILDSNYNEEQNLFIIDIDEDMSIEEAKNLFSSMTYLILTTKSHQVEKNGTVCDRFRIILPTLSTFHLKPDVYSRTYRNVLQALGVSEADEKCSNASRWYYPFKDAKYWYNEGDMLDIRPFIVDSVERKNSEQAMKNYDKEEAPDDQRVDGALRWFVNSTTNGNRNDNVFKLCMLLKDKIGITDWERWVVHGNACLTDPISDSDMKSTLSSASRR
jgi:hypothetical protein